jgi:hypothetical protein
MPDEEWLSAPRYAGEQDNLEAEARRLVALTREAQQRKETLARKLHDRLNGQPYVDAADWLARNDDQREQREQANGHTYPPAWEELARLARQIPRKRIGRPPQDKT